ncbi:hypothetical protein ACLOJK_032958 [Asimina triloba]
MLTCSLRLYAALEVVRLTGRGRRRVVQGGLLLHASFVHQVVDTTGFESLASPLQPARHDCQKAVHVKIPECSREEGENKYKIFKKCFSGRPAPYIQGKGETRPERYNGVLVTYPDR